MFATKKVVFQHHFLFSVHRCTKKGPDPPLHQVCTSREESCTNTPPRAPKPAKRFKPARGWSKYILFIYLFIYLCIYVFIYLFKQLIN